MWKSGNWKPTTKHCSPSSEMTYWTGHSDVTEGMRNNKTMRKLAMADFLSGWFFALENKDDIKIHKCSFDAK